MKYKCKKAGTKVTHIDYKDIEFACSQCDGIITVEKVGEAYHFVSPKIAFLTPPRVGIGAPFTCPALKPVEDIPNDENVEVMQ